MLLEHASYDYPSHLVPVADLLLTLLVLALLLRGGRDGRWARRLWRAARRASRSTPRLLCGLFLLGVVASAAVELRLGPPLPAVVDEISYLHAAETFAGGEPTRPVHPHQAHFEVMHVLQEPTVQSKYPPTQGLFLALGVLAGRPSLALWLLAGLLGAGVAWFLRLWLPPPWPLAGALAVLFRVGLGSYWNQSYWGGTLAALGALLLLGGLRRTLERPDPRPALVLAVGVLLLANTRPFEGLLFALPPAVLLAGWLFGFGGRWPGADVSVHRRWTRVGLPATLLLVAGAAAMGLYHRAVTGDPFLLPHLLYTEQAMPGFHHFRWPPQAAWSDWAGESFLLATERLAFDAFFFLGILGSLFAVCALPSRGGRRDLALPLACLAMVGVAGASTGPFSAHYAAPALPVFVLLAVRGLRRATLLARRRGRSGRWLPVAFVGIQLVLCLLQLPAHRVDADHPARQRRAVERFLLARPGDDLVILETSPLLADEWLRNAADPDTAPVIWARQLSPRENDALRRYYGDRRAFFLHIHRGGAELLAGDAGGPVLFSTGSAAEPNAPR